MKFTDGHWLKQPGVSIASPAEVRSYEVHDASVVLYAPPMKIVQRGMTLGGPLFTITLSSPQPGILAVDYTHFLAAKKEPRFPLKNANCPLTVKEEGNLLTVSSGAMSAEIILDNFHITYKYNGRVLTATGSKKEGYAANADRGVGYATTPEGPHMLEQLHLAVGEKIYGMGERFTSLVKNGQSVDIWNRDGGTMTDQSYKNVPFFLSSQDYGVLVDHAGMVSFEVATEVVSRIQLSIPGETLRYCIIGGDSRKEVLRAYTNLTGRPALPPAWSFGLWLTTSFTTDYNEETVTSFVDGMAERNIPLHVFHYDCFWMKEYEWCNFTWDEDMFPDVEGMLNRLKSKGLKICVWINSYIGQKSPLFKEAAAAGYLIKRPDGSPWQWDKWQPGMGIVDFSNPDACKWYQEKLRVLLRQGVDCFKTDFGERIPTDVTYFDGSDPVDMHNFHTYQFNKTVFDLLVEERGEGEACLFARSATAGSQAFPVHWGGDCDSTYVSMAESLRGGLSLTLSGFGFWSHDISGFESTATPDVYKRWTAFGLLSTHSRLHGSGSYRVPWLFDEEAVDVLRYFVNLKCRLMPYLFSTAVETHTTGVPSMRAMLLEFEKDPACLDVETQYMLGSRLLVAPIFREDGVATYYLPKGTWTHLLSGETVEGDGWREETYDYFSLPLFVRENTLLPMGKSETEADYDYADGLELRLYALKDGGTAETTVNDSKGGELFHAKAVRRGGDVTITLTGSAKPSLLLWGIDAVSGLNGATSEKTENGTLLTNLKESVSFSL
ncbi:alpha-xylosidase [Ruminococcaceae bacterium OttesenSCG-928-L11]|nr:alpha-xylosidase [Ruminococcaceae bacterium OttesenSCG-928-L11]